MPSGALVKKWNAVSLLKLELVRKANGGLDTIIYERTGVPPFFPLIVHTVIEKAQRRVARLFFKKPDPYNIYATWYRENRNFAEHLIFGWPKHTIGRYSSLLG